jgi:hypothetical protein
MADQHRRDMKEMADKMALMSPPGTEREHSHPTDL